MANRLKERYDKEILPALVKTLDLKNVMQAPRVEKVVLNIGLGEALDNAKAVDAAVADLARITGQSAYQHSKFQAARRPDDWHQGHFARRKNVVFSRPADECGPAARAGLPRNFSRLV